MDSLSLIRRQRWLLCVALIVLIFGAGVGFAAEPEDADKEQKLEEIIEAQQRQLDAQQKELEEQREMLQELLLRIEHEPAPTTVPAPEAEDSEPNAPVQEAQTEPDWPGSISLFDTKTRLAIGGFVQLDVIHDTDAIGAPCEFITATIPTDGGTPAQGADGQTNFCINTSRLTFESRTPTRFGRLTTFLSGDLYGDALSASPEPRVRQAYGELEGALWGGDLLVGQAWGTYVDLDAWPDILDFEGPGSAIAYRQPMVRWSKALADHVDLRIALEQPGNGAVQDADPLTRWPDLVGTLKWSHGGGHLRAAGLVRDLRASAADGRPASATGWGLAGSGKVILPAKSSFLFEASFGEGVGGYFNDIQTIGVYDPATPSLELVPLFAYYLAFDHSWSHTLSSSVLYAALDFDNLESQPEDEGENTGYISLNLIWRPITALMFGAEFLSGERRDKSGAEGTDNRLQLSGRFSF